MGISSQTHRVCPWARKQTLVLISRHGVCVPFPHWFLAPSCAATPHKKLKPLVTTLHILTLTRTTISIPIHRDICIGPSRRIALQPLKCSHQAVADLPQLCPLFRTPVSIGEPTLLSPYLYPTSLSQLSLSPPNSWFLRKG